MAADLLVLNVPVTLDEETEPLDPRVLGLLAKRRSRSCLSATRRTYAGRGVRPKGKPALARGPLERHFRPSAPAGGRRKEQRRPPKVSRSPTSMP
jgi:hypothetical protein